MIAKKETRFTTDASGKVMTVKRDFDASKDKVWAAWTESELLDKWWAPQPWIAVTKEMDFRPGGRWFYYMQGPEGEKHYCLINYITIDAKNSFHSEDIFCDEHGNPNHDFPSMKWTNNFIPSGDATRVEILINFKSKEDMQKIVEMGFKEGFEMGLNQLEEILR